MRSWRYSFRRVQPILHEWTPKHGAGAAVLVWSMLLNGPVYGSSIVCVGDHGTHTVGITRDLIPPLLVIRNLVYVDTSGMLYSLEIVEALAGPNNISFVLR